MQLVSSITTLLLIISQPQNAFDSKPTLRIDIREKPFPYLLLEFNLIVIAEHVKDKDIIILNEFYLIFSTNIFFY